jgi:nucleotide-binding universal stress UspA family protein
MKIDRILCPVDFSDYSRRALHYAGAIARWHDASLHVVHVVEFPAPTLPFMAPVPLPPGEEMSARSADLLREFIDRAHVQVPVQHDVLVGSPVWTILDHAQELDADLIVLGTHGLTGVQRVFLGSTAERVLHRATCPVLTIPRGAGEPPWAAQVQLGQVLVAVDFSPSSLAALTYGLSLTEEAGGQITLLHVLETLSDEESRLVAHYRVGEYVQARRQETLAELNALMAKVAPGRRRSGIVELGMPTDVIVRTASEINADLIVMGAQGRSAVTRLLFGSTTDAVVRRATCPVLTARTPKSMPARRLEPSETNLTVFTGSTSVS